jgi:nicotinamidase-related amidase
VLQTVLDLIACGYQTYVIVDAVAARGGVDHAVALERMAQAGASVISAEGVLFEWCETSDAAEFKQISSLVKSRMLNAL